MLNTRNVKLIDLSDWDNLVKSTYGRPYSFQQQDGCKSRGTEELEVPCTDWHDYENDTVPEEVNHEDQGVSFKAWLERDPDKAIGENTWETKMWWGRNFYPSVDMIANDLHARGLIEAGDYAIDIDW